MRIVSPKLDVLLLLLITVICLTPPPKQLCAQDAPLPAQLPPSIQNLSRKTAFFYAIHNGADFVKMLKQSDLAKKIAESGGVNEVSADGLREISVGGIDLSTIEVALDEPAAQALDAIGEHQADAESIVNQILQNDAILVGDDSWTTAWESLAKCAIIAKKTLSLEPGDEDSLKLTGTEALIGSEAFKKFRVPNTLLAFQLTDTAPASRLLAQVSDHFKKMTDEELGDWKQDEHKLGDGSLSVYSYPLDGWVDQLPDQEDLTEQDIAERKILAEVYRDRRLYVAFGLAESRLVFFFGEELQGLSGLVGTSAPPEPAMQLIATDGWTNVLPQPGEILIASAYASDRYVNSASALEDDGLLSNLMDISTVIGNTVKVDDVPLDQAAMGLGFAPGMFTQFTSKLKSVAKRWDALAPPKSGWAATISASATGIVGRGVSLSVDPRLPATPLTVDQHTGQDVIAFHARQGTATAQRWMIGYEFLSDAYVGFAQMMTAISGDETMDSVELHYKRLNQMPMRLAKIVQDHWLPAVGDGGQAIVVTRFDASPDDEHAPFEYSIISGVEDKQALSSAGDMIRIWANSWMNQYFEIIRKMDPDEDTEQPVIDPPTAVQDGDSTIFTVQIRGDDADENWGLSEFFHWRLSGNILAIGTNQMVTKQMLKPKPPIPSGRGLNRVDGIVRAVTWIDADQFAKIFDDVDDEEAKLIVETIRCVDCYHRVETTTKDKTIRRWKLTTALGKPTGAIEPKGEPTP